MRTVNIAALAQFCGDAGFSDYENQYSQRNKKAQIKERDQMALDAFVTLLCVDGDVQYKHLDGFFFSYCIPQISKEFDLLRITKDCVLNIELKSEMIDTKKIHKQLIRNRYYLGHLNKRIISVTFISDGHFYALNDDEQLIEIPLEAVKQTILETCEIDEIEDIDTLFRPSMFLISPLNTPDEFLNGDYFLTDQQEEIKTKILERIEKKQTHYFGITGKAGTGKTLLLYDIAKSLCQEKKCLIIHCAPLSRGHVYLNEKLTNCKIIIPKDYTSSYFDERDYDVILFDEFHRAYDNAFEKAKNEVEKNGKIVIFSYDFSQHLAQSEVNRNSRWNLDSIRGMIVFPLSDKIRTNREIADFIKIMLQPKKYEDIPRRKFQNVTVLYSKDRTITKEFIDEYSLKGYQFINHSVSLRIPDAFDSLEKKAKYNSHSAIGLEFDNVLVVINELFYYDDGRLGAHEHACRDYLYTQLLYEEVTRAREKLCIVVENNPELMRELMKCFNIDGNM